MFWTLKFNRQTSIVMWSRSNSFISMCSFLFWNWQNGINAYHDREPVRIFAVISLHFATKQINAKETFVSWNFVSCAVLTVINKRKSSLPIDCIKKSDFYIVGFQFVIRKKRSRRKQRSVANGTGKRNNQLKKTKVVSFLIFTFVNLLIKILRWKNKLSSKANRKLEGWIVSIARKDILL